MYVPNTQDGHVYLSLANSVYGDDYLGILMHAYVTYVVPNVFPMQIKIVPKLSSSPKMFNIMLLMQKEKDHNHIGYVNVCA